MNDNKKVLIISIVMQTILISYLCMQVVYAFVNVNSIFNVAEIVNLLKEDLFDVSVVFNNIREPYMLKAFGVGALISFAMTYILSNTKKQNFSYKGKEHGSARFARKKEMESVQDKDHQNNVILSQNAKISMNGKKIRRNMNVAVFGGSGAGKTFFFLKPNLLQLHSSYIITDPKGEILRSIGKYLKENGYKVKVLNLIEMEKSDMYNPFDYIDHRNQHEVITLIKFIMANTNDGEKSKDPFWDSAETMLMTALFFYVLEKAGKNERNIDTVMYLANLIDLNKGEGEKDVVDLLFEELEKEDSNHIAVRNWKAFKNGGEKNQGSILLTNSARLSLFNVDTVRTLLQHDTLELEKIGEEKTALFIIVSPTDSSFNFIAGMMYTQLFKILDDVANRKYGGSLPIPVRFLLDEFANIGKIPNFEKILAYARSLNVGITPIFQSLGQLKEMYEKSWGAVLDNCDSTLFLGGQDIEGLKYFSEKLGKVTIDIRSQNKSYGQSKSTSLNDSLTGRELLTPEELSRMDVNKCIAWIKGLRPIFDDKFNTLKHKDFDKLADNNPKNAYVHKPMRLNMKEPKADVVFEPKVEHYEVDEEIENYEEEMFGIEEIANMY